MTDLNRIRCDVCGMPWQSHDEKCSQHQHRARYVLPEDSGDGVYRFPDGHSVMRLLSKRDSPKKWVVDTPDGDSIRSSADHIVFFDSPELAALELLRRGLGFAAGAAWKGGGGEMSDKPNLKHCPFCGGAAEIERYGTARQSTQVACTECGCRLESPETFHHGSTWNQRKGLTDPVPAVLQWRPGGAQGGVFPPELEGKELLVAWTCGIKMYYDIAIADKIGIIMKHSMEKWYWCTVSWWLPVSELVGTLPALPKGEGTSEQ